MARERRHLAEVSAWSSRLSRPKAHCPSPFSGGGRHRDYSWRNRNNAKNGRLRATTQYPSSTSQISGGSDRIAAARGQPSRASTHSAARPARRWRLLVGGHKKSARPILPPDPGGDASSEASGAVPEQPVLSFWAHPPARAWVMIGNARLVLPLGIRPVAHIELTFRQTKVGPSTRSKSGRAATSADSSPMVTAER